MKDYYQILRVSRHASEVEIKRAYRRLAIVFHPDKNPSEEASALFQEINEAHEVLMDRDKRVQYDFILRGGARTAEQEPEPRYHRDPAYRRRPNPTYRKPRNQPSEHLLMMAHFLKYLRPICFVGFGWCAFLLMDFLLPSREYDEKVLSEANRIYGWRYDHMPYIVVTDKKHQFAVARDGLNYFPVGSHVKVIRSRIMDMIVRVDSEKKDYSIFRVNSVYSNFLFAPLILMIVSIFGISLQNGIEFRFSVGVLICMTLLINFVFLISSLI